MRHPSGPFKPSIFGNLELSGTLTSTIDNSEVTEALRLNFPCILFDVNPFIPFSNKNPLMIPDSSFAQTTATSAKVPLVIHIFEPLIIQSSPSFFAVVAMPPGLEPKFASVKPKQPINSPEPNPGSHLFFCSSEPYA